MKINIYSIAGSYNGMYTDFYPIKNWIEKGECDIIWYQFPMHIDDGMPCWTWNLQEDGSCKYRRADHSCEYMTNPVCSQYGKVGVFWPIPRNLFIEYENDKGPFWRWDLRNMSNDEIQRIAEEDAEQIRECDLQLFDFSHRDPRVQRCKGFVDYLYKILCEKSLYSECFLIPVCNFWKMRREECKGISESEMDYIKRFPHIHMTNMEIIRDSLKKSMDVEHGKFSLKDYFLQLDRIYTDEFIRISQELIDVYKEVSKVQNCNPYGNGLLS